MTSLQPNGPIEVFAPRELTTPQHTWGREILLCQMPGFIGKLLLMKKGTAGGLQYHREKVEAFFLDEGQAFVEYDAGDGRLTKIVMAPGMTVQVPAGAVHRVTAIEDCRFIEWSSPVFHDRVRVEEEYGEPEVDGLPTTMYAKCACGADTVDGRVCRECLNSIARGI